MILNETNGKALETRARECSYNCTLIKRYSLMTFSVKRIRKLTSNNEFWKFARLYSTRLQFEI